MISHVLSNRTVEVKSDATLEIALAVKENALLVHLLSYFPERRPGIPPVVERMPPVHNIKLKVRLGKSPVKVWQSPENRSLQYKFCDGVLQTIIPDLQLHTAVVIEM